MIDIAGNMYPAGIPVPTDEPVLTLDATLSTALVDGWYAYAYVYAAKNRYPYLDAGKAMQGSIAPRGNPSPFETIEVSGGPRGVEVEVFASDRLDVDQIIIYRTIMWATEEEATLAANAGQMFSIAMIANPITSALYVDNALIPTSNEQIEYDNNFAPTMQYLAYESPFLWGIGNDPLIKQVSWAADTITLQDSGKWFEGRNGQLATISGITSGGLDGRGTFLFKAGDEDGNNLNTSAILTIDGETPETLVPPTGTGYIKIVGPATTLYRSKPRNPLAWGETVFVGTARFSSLFARKISGSKASAIAVVPGGEYLKIDVKDPSKTYTFSLRSAGTPNFETSRREISDMSVSYHFSQFIASRRDGQKVLWGWDVDNHAILECDGNTQRIVSQNVFDTLRNCQSITTRAQYSQGLCNEELELNIMFVPWGTGINATDLAVFQHYPSEKWGTALVGDLLSTGYLRDPLTNLLRHIGGRDSGLLVEHQQELLYQNQFTGFADILTFGPEGKTINIFNGQVLTAWAGSWVLWYCNSDDRIKIGRVSAVNLDSGSTDTILTLDAVLTMGTGSQDYDDNVFLTDALGAKIFFGSIPVFLEKILELGNATSLKTVHSISLTGLLTPFGDNYGVARLYMYSPNFEVVERLPSHASSQYFDDVQSNQGSYVFQKVNTSAHPRISLRIAHAFQDDLKIRMLNLDVR